MVHMKTNGGEEFEVVLSPVEFNQLIRCCLECSNGKQYIIIAVREILDRLEDIINKMNKFVSNQNYNNNEIINVLKDLVEDSVRLLRNETLARSRFADNVWQILENLEQLNELMDDPRVNETFITFLKDKKLYKDIIIFTNLLVKLIYISIIIIINDKIKIIIEIDEDSFDQVLGEVRDFADWLLGVLNSGRMLAA